MIRNRLSELFSERGLKISRVAKEVEIARSSLTSMVQNESGMIRYDAIDKLCSFLNIEPQEFFEFIPIDIDISFDNSSIFLRVEDNGPYYNLEESLNIVNFSFDFLVDLQYKNERYSFDLVCDLKNITQELFGYNSFNFYIKDESNQEKLSELMDILSPGMKHVFFKQMKTDLKTYVIEELKEKIKSETSSVQIDSELEDTIDKSQFILLSNIFTEY